MRSVYMRLAYLPALAFVFQLALACEAGPPPVAPAPPAPTREESCVLAARACSKHIFDGHPEGLVDCMPEEIVTRLGGRDALIAIMKNGKDKDAPPDVEDTVIEAPSQMVKGEKRTFAVVPQTVAVKVPEGRLILKSYLLGVSADEGKTWRFVDGVELDRPKALSLFPDLAPGITLPKVGEPELLPTEKPPANPK